MQAVPADSNEEQAGAGRAEPGIALCHGTAGLAPASLRTQPASAEQVRPGGCELMPQAAGVQAQGHCIEAVSTCQSSGGLPALALHVGLQAAAAAAAAGMAQHMICGNLTQPNPCHWGSTPCNRQAITPKHFLAP